MNAVVLISGGMDSSVLLRMARVWRPKARFYALSFDYAQKHARELECARVQASLARVEEHCVMNFAEFGSSLAVASALTNQQEPVPDMAAIDAAELDQPSTYVPHRNLVFLALAAAYAESKGCADVFYGAQRQDKYGYWDCTNEFVGRLNKTLALNRRRPVKINAPFANLSKLEVLKRGLENGVDFSLTWTCYRGGAKACGLCPACSERLAAFSGLGIKDPLPYQSFA